MPRGHTPAFRFTRGVPSGEPVSGARGQPRAWGADLPRPWQCLGWCRLGSPCVSPFVRRDGRPQTQVCSEHWRTPSTAHRRRENFNVRAPSHLPVPSPPGPGGTQPFKAPVGWEGWETRHVAAVHRLPRDGTRAVTVTRRDTTAPSSVKRETEGLGQFWARGGAWPRPQEAGTNQRGEPGKWVETRVIDGALGRSSHSPLGRADSQCRASRASAGHGRLELALPPARSPPVP